MSPAKGGFAIMSIDNRNDRCGKKIARDRCECISSRMQAGGSNWQTVSTDIGKSWSDPTGINLGVHNGTSVGPGRGLQLSEDSPAPGRILFIGHHGPYEVSNIPPTLQEKSAL